MGLLVKKNNRALLLNVLVLIGVFSGVLLVSAQQVSGVICFDNNGNKLGDCTAQECQINPGDSVADCSQCTTTAAKEACRADADFCKHNFCNPLSSNTFEEFIGKLTNTITFAAGSIVVVVIVLGGIMYIVSGDSPEKRGGARKTIIWGLIGFGIVLISSMLVSLVSVLL